MTTIKTIQRTVRVKLPVILFVLTFLFSFYSEAQELPCANEIIQTNQLKDSAFVRLLKETHPEFNNVALRINGTILEIPIVVHVLHLGEPIGTGTNISDQQIFDAVEGTNERWRKINSSDGVDMEVQFCLAQFDPQGNPSNGIVRKDASTLPNYTQYGISYIGALGEPGSDEIATKNLSNWPHNYVYNIWVVNKIAGGWGGYAFFPLGFDYATDGTIIISTAIRYSSSTLAHELGHGMGLFHTFQGDDGNNCPANSICFLQGDWICDTPPHRQSDCNNSFCQNTADSLNATKNIMSYCSGRGFFTQGQKDRVRNNILTTSRSLLVRSRACTGLTTSIRNQVNTNTLTVYPNPTNGNFVLQTEIQSTEHAEVFIIDMLGRMVLQQKLTSGTEHTISVSDKIAKGTYQLQLKKNGTIENVTQIILL